MDFGNEAPTEQSAGTDELTAALYEPLRSIAHKLLAREDEGHTLSTTALVHEAFLRLARQRDVEWQGRGHFLAIGARVMRRVLVDHARARLSEKRERHRVFDIVAVDLALEDAPGIVDFISLDEALTRFAAHYPRQARVVELRFFGGLDTERIAEVMEMSPRTVKRDWQFAKAWLVRDLEDRGEL
ncbi:MAG: ECF-type sigma factor [Gemmatimonadaceae bacterium]